MSEAVMDLDFLAHLPGQRDLLERVLACYGPDRRVLGLMLYGSLAQGEGDAFSDIDLNVVVEPAHQGDLLAEAPATTAAFGRALYAFRGGRDEPTQFYAYYESHVKLDLDFMLPGQIGVYAERRNHRIFKDATGELALAVEQAERLPERFVPDPAAMAALDAMFWVRCADAAAKAVRGELWRARAVVEDLRVDGLARLVACLNGLRPTGYRRIETRLSPGWLAGWEDTVAWPDRDSILAAVAGLVACYLPLRDAVAQQLEMTFDPAREELMHRRLIALGVPLALPSEG